MTPTLSLEEARAWLARWIDLREAAGKLPRARAYRSLVADVVADITSPEFWPRLPRRIRHHFARHGFAWNGLYVQEAGGDLLLTAAAGPPVCGHLEAPRELHAGGMCHDVLRLGQTLFAPDVKRWPGYVSCDGESGLETLGGLAVPVRNAAGRVLAVWDLDATEPLDGHDPAFFDALIATLGRATDPTPAALGLGS